MVDMGQADRGLRTVLGGDSEGVFARHRERVAALRSPLEPMKFHQTFEIYTEESIEAGEAEETGFDWQDVQYTFRELVDMLEREYYCAEPSDSHGVPRWVTSYGEADFRTGNHENKSLHPANDRARRWWPKALRAAGIVKENSRG